MAGQRQTTNLGCTSVQDMKEDALALLHSYGLAVSQHAAIDGERAIADLVSLRHTLGQRHLHRRLTLFFQGFHFSGRRQEIHRHVSATTERGLKLFQREKHFAVIISWLMLGLNVNRANLPTILSGS